MRTRLHTTRIVVRILLYNCVGGDIPPAQKSDRLLLINDNDVTLGSNDIARVCSIYMPSTIRHSKIVA